MKKVYFLLLTLFCTAGCYSTTWECRSGECQSMSYQMAMNKCLAQANSAFSDMKLTIWQQCMRGYGFEEIRCEENQFYPNPCVALGMHVM